MEEIKLLVILLLSGLSTPSPYFREYHFVNQRTSWTEAQSHCRERFTDMVTIYNSDINQLLLTIVQNRNDITDYSAWIGLYDNVYSWRWSMEDKNIDVGTTRVFLIWLKNQPNNLYADQYCVVVQGQTELNDLPCGNRYPFLCYDANTTSYVLVKQEHTWSEAQSYCRKHHTDLASIRSKEEKSKVALVWKGSGLTYSWIGLHRDPWAFWSDNSTSAFSNWTPSQPNNDLSNEYCAAFNLNSGQWDDGTCSKMKPFFCFTAVTKQTTVKLKIQSEVDMNSIEIQQQVLYQLEAHMLSKRLTNFEIHWRNVQSYRENHWKKPDGESD